MEFRTSHITGLICVDKDIRTPSKAYVEILSRMFKDIGGTPELLTNKERISDLQSSGYRTVLDMEASLFEGEQFALITMAAHSRVRYRGGHPHRVCVFRRGSNCKELRRLNCTA